MNLAMHNLPSNLKSSLHKTWQTLLLFLKPLQIHNLKRKKWGDYAYYTPHLKKWGDTSPVSPIKLRPCNQSWLRSRWQTILAQIWQIAPKWIYTVSKIFSPFTIFEQLALALKKQSFPWNFSLYWIHFLPFRIFEQLCACPEKQSSPEIFHCIEYAFSIQDFWATCMRLPWKTEGALNSQHWLYIFYHSGLLSNLRFPWKTEFPWNFSLYWNIFCHSEFLSNLRLPWKQSLPWNVWSRRATSPPPGTPMFVTSCQSETVKEKMQGKQIC